MKWIMNIEKKYKLPYYLSNICLIFFDTIGFIIPIITGYLVDKITIQNDYSNLLLITIAVIIFSLLRYLGSYFFVIKVEMLSEKITSKIKEKCYQNLNNLDYYFFEHTNRGELMTNFTSDIRQICYHIFYNVRNIITTILTFLCSFIYLLTINIPFTFILLTPGIVIGIISYYFVKSITPKYEHLWETLANSNDYISDNIEGNKVVKSFALENYEIKKMNEINKKYIAEDIDVSLLNNSFYAKVDFLSNLMSPIFLIIGSILYFNNQITLGELIIFNAYLHNLRAPFTRIGSLMNNLERYKTSKKRLQALLNAKPIIKLLGEKKLKSLNVPIEFKNVQVIYDKKIVLDNLNLKINPHETVAFIGKTGSGKSTIVNLLLGFITPKKGEILLDGENYLNYNIKDIREKIGYVTQNAFLFSDTIYNNISYGVQDLDKKEALKYARLACCYYINNLEEGIDTVIGEKGVGLSGGEKQRLSLARALAVKPDILLLDDITSALDIETEEKINESIENLDYKATKIIIASKIVSVKNADCIYVIDDGRIIEQGNHQELLKKKGYYYELYNIGKEKE